jgi:hypothetical protein
MKFKIKSRALVSMAAWCFISGILILSSCKERGKPSVDTEEVKPGTSRFADTATSTVHVFDQNGRVCVQQSNTYYQLADVYEGTSKIPLLLKIKKTELCFADSVNTDKVYQIEAKSIMDTKSVAWKNQFVATDMQFKDNTLLATHEGKDGEEDFLTRFSLLDGKEIFSCSYGELKAIVPNVRNKRFLGFTSKKAATSPIQNRKEENLLGIVRYSNGTKEVNGFKLLLKRTKVTGKIPLSTPDMILVPASSNATTMEEGKAVIMMKADEHYTPQDLTGFSLQLTFYYGDDNESTVITIPVTDDQLDFAHAKFDKDIFEIAAL